MLPSIKKIRAKIYNEHLLKQLWKARRNSRWFMFGFYVLHSNINVFYFFPLQQTIVFGRNRF